MLFFCLFVVVTIIVPSKLTLLPIRYATIDLLYQHGYIVSDITYQIGLGMSVSNLELCIYACYNNDFCRTAVFDSQLLVCSLFEECSDRGQIISNISTTLISFVLCNGEPDNMAFIHPLTTPVPLPTVMSNLQWIKDIAVASWYPFFVNDQFYVPLSNVINVYETDTYTLVQSVQIPVTSGIYFVRGDSQGTFIYSQNGDSNIYIYSLSLNIVTQVNSSRTNFKLCYSTSFIVITSVSSTVDVYLRSITNNSATFLYRIGGWNSSDNCAIINDQQLIIALWGGGLQTTILNKINHNSTVVTLPLSTSYLPTGAMVTMDTAGRLYTAAGSNRDVSTVFLSNGTLIGIHNGTSDSVGKANKHKFIFVSTNGNTLSVFEYTP